MAKKIKYEKRDVYPEVKRYLDSYGKSIIKQAKKIIQKKKKVASGKLLKSLKYEIKYVEKKGFDIEFKGAKHADYIDKGVQGLGRGILPPGSTVGQHGVKMKPNRTYIDPVTGKRKRSPYSFRTTASKKTNTFYKSLDSWIIRRGLAPRDDKGKFVSRKSLKYIVARGIKAKGIEGISFYSQPIAASRNKLKKDLLQKFGEDVLNRIAVN